jgi:glycosyltransferase involved in cell wall biosynthesis
VGYFGGMEPDRGVDDLAEAIGLLRRDGAKVQLVLGGKPPAGFDLARPGVLYMGNVPYADMPTALSACDLLAIPYRRTPFMDAGSSNKIAEAIACRRPIVATRTPNLMANFPMQAAQLDAVLAEPGNPDSLARSIRLQSEQRLLVDLPEGMAWGDIAGDLATRLGMFDNSQRTGKPASS